MVWLGWLYTPMLMLLLLWDGLLLSPSPKLLRLGRTVTPRLSIGKRAPVELHAANQSGYRLHVEIADSAPQNLLPQPKANCLKLSLQPYENTSAVYEIAPSERGVYSFQKIHARYRSRLGLLWITMQDGQPDAVKVTPDLQRIRRLRVQASRAMTPGELKKRTLGLEGTHFSGLRHYFAGDDIRKMAWQATAKLEQPVIRTFEPEVEQPVLVLLDAGRKMNNWTGGLCKYDWALNAALALMAVALDRRDTAGAVVFSNRLLAQVPFGSGGAHWQALLETLSETRVQQVEPDYASVMFQVARRLQRRTLVVLFTDLIDLNASVQLVQGLKAFSKNHTLLIATLSDQDMLAQAQKIPDSAYGVYRKGVTLDLLEQRRQALAKLARYHRATVIDAPPQHLDETLIQRYVQLRQRSGI